MSLTRLLFAVFISSAFIFSGASVTECAAQSESVSIKLRSARLRRSPQHWAPGSATLKLGDSLTLLEMKDGWAKVRTSSGAAGYVHETAISDKPIVLKASNRGSSGTSSDDVVLAGKGFNKEVEREFAAQNPNASFADVNRMEAISVRESDLVAFMKAGGLKTNG
ncbi:MAG: SH3 domain-containing protein [Deltaproteobacteria bacterium]|nr:SH3 domain-containing protein [Deltaproteobacteria bacterium]